MVHLKTLDALLLGLVLVAAIGQEFVAGAQADQRLFPSVTAGDPGSQPADSSRLPSVLRSSRRAVSWERLAEAAEPSRAGASLLIELFDDVAVTAVVTTVDRDSLGYWTIVGDVPGQFGSTVTLTWKGTVLSGNIHIGHQVFRISANGAVAHIEELRPPALENDAAPVSPQSLHPSVSESTAGAAAASEADVFVHYTSAARVEKGGVAAIEAAIARNISEFNTAAARSGVGGRIRLVGMSELSGFTVPYSYVAALDQYRNDAAVRAAREAIGADLMHLVVPSFSINAGGGAYSGPPNEAYGFGMTSLNTFDSYGMTHELGHNLGSNHAPQDPGLPPPDQSFRPYSYGYKDCSSTPFYTVMAYGIYGCPSGTPPFAARILNFSNPAVAHTGVPTGTAAQDNARSISEAFPLVSAYRTATNLAVPSEPRLLRAVVNQSTVTISWDPPAVGSPIADYILQAGSGPGRSDLFEGSVGAVTSISASVPDGQYFLRVMARNVLGTGPASTEIATSVANPPPSPPSNLVADVRGSHLTLSWNPSTQGGPVLSYLVQAGSVAGSANLYSGSVGLVTTVSADVPPGQYFLRVISQSVRGDSAPTADVVANVGACTVSAAPVASWGNTGRTVNVTWSVPSGQTVTDYRLVIGSASGRSDIFDGRVGNVTAVSGQVTQGLYFVRVRAVTQCGEGLDSNELRISVP